MATQTIVRELVDHLEKGGFNSTITFLCHPTRTDVEGRPLSEADFIAWLCSWATHTADATSLVSKEFGSSLMVDFLAASLLRAERLESLLVRGELPELTATVSLRTFLKKEFFPRLAGVRTALVGLEKSRQQQLAVLLGRKELSR